MGHLFKTTVLTAEFILWFSYSRNSSPASAVFPSDRVLPLLFCRYNHSFAVVGEQIFLFGGCSEDGSQLRDMYALNTGTAGSILNDDSHPLHRAFLLLPSRRRFIVPKCRTKQYIYRHSEEQNAHV